MSTLVKFLKGHKILLILPALVLVGAMYVAGGEKVSPFETMPAKRMNIIQEVSVTGRVNSESVADLAFERGGRVIATPALVGARVSAGAPLVRLDTAELSALRAQAEANLEYEIANLAQLNIGARKEDIAISEAKVGSARVSLSNALLGVADKIRGAYSVADDAVRNDTDVLWRNPRTQNPELIISVTDSKLLTTLPPFRIRIENELRALELIASTVDGSAQSAVLSEGLATTENVLTSIKEYLNDLALALGGATPSASISQATLDTYKASVALARTNVDTLITAILGVDKEMRAAESALKVAENELALKKSGPTKEALAASEAKVASARATVGNYDAQLEKSTLRAPFAGVVTRNDARLGETVSPNTKIVSLMSDGKWKIEANVAEVDVAKISIGDSAKITLDAYGSDVVFDAAVALIDPAETVLEGVSTYKVTLYFKNEDERIRSGMTADITISTDGREGVLGVPARAVATKDGKKFVRVLAGDSAIEKEVTLGLRGSDGAVEVLSGLNEGDSVVIFEKK